MWVVYWLYLDWEILLTGDENFFINYPDCNESHWLIPGTVDTNGPI